MTRESHDPTYRGQVDPIKSDKTGRIIQPSTLRRLVIKLDNALQDAPFRVNGDFLYADLKSTGAADIKLNGTGEDPIPFVAQSMVEGIPIKDIAVTCSAQAGQVLNLWYGYQARIRPPQANVTVGGSLSLAVTSAGAPQGIDKTVSNNNAFKKYFLRALVAGQNPYVQVFNAVASGKVVYVDAYILHAPGAAGDYAMAFDTAALANDAGAMHSLDHGAADATVHMFHTNAAADPGTQGELSLIATTAGSVSPPILLPYPHRLDPGHGLNIKGPVGVALGVTFFVREF